MVKSDGCPIAFRYMPEGRLFGVAGGGIFGEEKDLIYVQGLCNSSYMTLVARLLSPTLNYEVGQIASYPYRNADGASEDSVNELVVDSRRTSKEDWDSFETSWDFKRHPLV